jgi:hypothetical protein
MRYLRPHCAVILILSLLAPIGCIRQVTLHSRTLTRMTPANVPTTRGADGTLASHFRPRLEGQTQTLRYDWLLWRIGRLALVRGDDGNLVMLDTGLNEWGRVTLDVAERGRHPTELSAPRPIVYCRSLLLGSVRFNDLPATAWPRTWQCDILGLPIYRMRGWVLGSWPLRKARFLAFDNRARTATIGMDDFVAPRTHEWSSYPMTWRNGVPFVDMPVAGETMPLLADSAGGPNLMLTRQQWDRIAPRLQIRRHREHKYPSWEGYEKVDAYFVRELPFGPLTLRNIEVWVLRADSNEQPSFGLGVLPNATAVWDFAAKQFRVGVRSVDRR